MEVPLAMYSSFKPRGYLDEEILYRLANPDSYNLEVVHGGYTYMAYGIPLVLGDNQRIFLGWDYNHSEDTESCVTYNDIINEGKKVIESMFKNIEENIGDEDYESCKMFVCEQSERKDGVGVFFERVEESVEER